MKQIVDQTGYYPMYDPDIVILQAGMIDCVPRVLGKFERELLSKLIMGNYVIKHIKNNAKKYRRIRKKVWTPPGIFSNELVKLRNVFDKRVKFISIGIVETKNILRLKQLPGITNNIRKYNTILKKEFKTNYISIENMPDNYLMQDGVHFTELAHAYTYKKIVKLINKI